MRGRGGSRLHERRMPRLVVERSRSWSDETKPYSDVRDVI